MYHPERAIRSAFIGGRKHGATAEAELDRILATSAPERRRAAWPQRVVIGTGAVAILIAGIALLRPVPAEAALTPPMLEMSPTNREAARSSMPMVLAPSRTITRTSWPSSTNCRATWEPR